MLQPNFFNPVEFWFTNDLYILIFDFLYSTHFQPNGLQPEVGYNPKYLTELKFDGFNRKVATQKKKFGLGWLKVG
jgi:hypothetical protein